MPGSAGSALKGSVVRPGNGQPASLYAARLLELMGARCQNPGPDEPDAHAGLVLDGVEVSGTFSPSDETEGWAACGAMVLTGQAGGPPLVAPGAPATAARGAALAIQALTEADPSMRTVTIDGARLLGERAALAGLKRNGSVSPGGSCRLVHASDGLLAVNLPRSSDLTLVSAWLEVDATADPWAAVMHECSRRSTVDLVERAQLAGLPVALVPQPGEAANDEQGLNRRLPTKDRSLSGFPLGPWRVTGENPRDRHDAGAEAAGERGKPGLVVDLSSMWAGPLCANLLGLAGFRVVKVESASRLDGARNGPAAFFDLLHCGHESIVVDFRDRAALARLSSLLATADVVIESSRPRALDQLDLGPSVILARSPATVWVSITGYGRSGPWQNRVAFGDDAAAAAGMIASDADGNPMFCGDALADPLAGLHAALVALAMCHAGHGALVDVALRDVVASTLAGVPVRPDISPAARLAGGGWVLDTPSGAVAVNEPTARPVLGPAAEPGTDTDRVFNELASV